MMYSFFVTLKKAIAYKNTQSVVSAVPIWMILGIILATTMQIGLVMIVVVVLGLIAFCVSRKIMIVSLIFFAIGFASFKISRINDSKRGIIKEYIENVSIKARVKNIIQRESHLSITVEVLSIDSPLNEATFTNQKDSSNKPEVSKNIIHNTILPKIVVLSYHNNINSIEFGQGDILTVNANLFPIPVRYYFSAYNYTKKLYYNGVDGFGKILFINSIEHAKQSINFNNVRLYLVQKISEHTSKTQGSIINALFLGERASLSKKINDDMIRSGLAHALSISGMHVAIVSSIFIFLVNFLLGRSEYLLLRIDVKKIAMLASALFCFLYIAMSGFPVPAVRSFIIICIASVAYLFARDTISIRSLSFAMVPIILFVPHEVFFASFQLSFLSVLSLIWWFELFLRVVSCNKNYEDEKPKRSFFIKALFYLLGIGLSSIVVSMSNFNISIYHFGSFSLSGIFANMACIPLLTFVTMPLGIITILLIPFGVYLPFLKALAFSVDIFVDIAKFFASGKFSYVTLIGPSDWLFAAIALTIICIFIFRGFVQYVFCGLFVVFNVYYILVDIPQNRPLFVVNKDLAVLSYEKNPKEFYTIYKNSKVKGVKFVEGVIASELGLKKFKTVKHPKECSNKYICSFERFGREFVVFLPKNKKEYGANDKIINNCRQSVVYIDLTLIEKNACNIQNYYSLKRITNGVSYAFFVKDNRVISVPVYDVPI